MKKHIATLVLLPLVLGLAGCPLVTLTEGFEYDVLFWQNGGNPYDLSGRGDWTDVVDLSNEQDFKDNQDKIENVDRVAFRGFMHTLNSADAIADIFFREPAAQGEDPNEWLIIVENLAVPGTSDADTPFEFTYANTEPLIKNFTQFQKLATKGVMELTVRTRTGNDEVLITKLILYVAFSGG